MATATINVKPLGDRILIKRIEEDEQVRGGIIIPDSAKEKSQEAEVVALGTGKKNDKGEKQEFDVKQGDRVLISQYAGTPVKIEGDEYMLVREDDILGIIG